MSSVYSFTTNVSLQLSSKLNVGFINTCHTYTYTTTTTKTKCEDLEQNRITILFTKLMLMRVRLTSTYGTLIRRSVDVDVDDNT